MRSFVASLMLVVMFSLECLWLLPADVVGYFYNADVIQPFLMIEDLLKRPEWIWGWTLSPANFIFPDMLLALPLVVLAPWQILPIVTFGFLFAGYSTLAARLVRVASGVPLAPAVLSAGTIFFLVIAACAYRSAQIGSHMTLEPGSLYIHTGALLVGLFLAERYISFRRMPATRWSLIATTILAGLTAFSDVLFVLWFVAPIALVALPERARNKALNSAAWHAVIAWVGASILARVADAYMRPIRALPTDFSASVHQFWESVVLAPAHLDWMMTLAAAVSVAMAIHAGMALVRLWRTGEIADRSVALIVLAGVQWSSWVVPVASGHLSEPLLLRYSLPVFLVPYVWLLIALPLKAVANKFVAVAEAAVLIVASMSASTSAAASLETAIGGSQDFVSCLETSGLTMGMGDYWLSKQIIFFSEGRVSVVPISAGGEQRVVLGNNVRWFERSVDGQLAFRPTFIVIYNLVPQAMEARFGAPDRRIRCGALEVWAYEHVLEIPPL